MNTHKGSRSRIADHEAARLAWERIWGKRHPAENKQFLTTNNMTTNEINIAQSIENPHDQNPAEQCCDASVNPDHSECAHAAWMGIAEMFAEPIGDEEQHENAEDIG